jgi:hypothetical protein
MLVGYNTNVPYKGKLYHVQTEDNGLRNPVITTLLYLKGSILASKKTSYEHLAGDPDYEIKVREIMKEQHREMIKGLVKGEYTGGGSQQQDMGKTASSEAEESSDSDSGARARCPEA